MGSLQFMNQDGEWQKFPEDDDLALMTTLNKMQDAGQAPLHLEITTICHLCNEPFPMEQIMITGGNMFNGYTWSCPKCHAITSLGKA